MLSARIRALRGHPAPVLAATAVGVFVDGGYAREVRVVFGVAALAAAALTVRRWPREPVVWVLVALAAVGAMSVIWTVGLPADTLVWALVTAGYAALVAAAAVVAERAGGVLVLMAGLAAISAICAALGLASAALGQSAFAVHVAGVWRPAGPFGYPPALALVQVGALPALMAAVGSPRRTFKVAGLVGLALAAAVLVLAASRTGLALAVLTVGAVLGWTASDRRPVGARRRLAVGAAVIVVAVVSGGIAFGAAADRGAGPNGGFLHGRGTLWHAAVQTFADRPVLGAGADAFLAASARHQNGQTITFAHDLPLEFAAELGLIGLGLALALYAANAALLWRARATPVIRLAGPASVAFLTSTLLDWPWHLAGSGAAWAVATGTLVGGARQRDARRSRLSKGLR